MNRKPDMIRSLVIIFVAGLVITGFSQIAVSEKSSPAPVSQLVQYEGTDQASRGPLGSGSE